MNMMELGRRLQGKRARQQSSLLNQKQGDSEGQWLTGEQGPRGNI